MVASDQLVEKVIVKMAAVCLKLCEVSLISVRKKRMASFNISFLLLMRLEDYLLFRLGAGFD